MSYRDDDEALRAYHDDLVRELARLDTQLAPLHDLAARRERMIADLARVRADLDDRAARQAPPRLARIRVATPCRESWAGMVGDHRSRHCNRCNKAVYDLSAMTTTEAEALLAEHGTSLCVRFYRRADGTVKTADCPDGKRRLAIAMAAGAMSLAAGVTAAAVAASGSDRPSEIIQGGIAPPVELPNLPNVAPPDVTAPPPRVAPPPPETPSPKPPKTKKRLKRPPAPQPTPVEPPDVEEMGLPTLDD